MRTSFTIASIVLAMALVPPSVGPSSVDKEMTRAVRESVRSDRLVMSVIGVRPRRRHTGKEYLVALATPSKRFVLKLDRPSKQRYTITKGCLPHCTYLFPRRGCTRSRSKLKMAFKRRNMSYQNKKQRTTEIVVLEVGGRTEKMDAPYVTESRVIESIVVLIDQRGDTGSATVYINCRLAGKIRLETNLRKLFEGETDHLEVMRERRYLMELDSDTEVGEVLKRYGCKDEDERMQAQQPTDNTLPRRGDIPIIHDCDDNVLVKSINDLIKVVKMLQVELEEQRVETRNLRQLLEQCDICKPEPENSCNRRPGPCFPGVDCHDTSEGPRCGRCPTGYVGDGFKCKPGINCDQRPCYPGVRCYDTVEGFQCGPCPAGMTGNGQHCTPKSGCERNPCSPGVQCQNTHEPPYYRCGPCPPGFTGNGTDCHDLDECDLAEPCDPRVHCTNMIPGFRCGPCPSGFTGSGGFEGVGLEAAARTRQTCHDIDECADGRNGGCAHNSVCHNTEGSYTCGQCKNGYVGNQTVGCHNSPGMCPDGTRCDSNAECIRTSSRYRCKCKVGWAGDGRVCGPDRDLDGWPDYDLGCSDPRCHKKNQE